MGSESHEAAASLRATERPRSAPASRKTLATEAFLALLRVALSIQDLLDLEHRILADLLASELQQLVW